MSWKLSGSKKDKQGITSAWEITEQKLIDGVKIKQMKNVIKNEGLLTEIYRSDWELDDTIVDQVFQIKMNPNSVSGWHAHEFTTDRIFINKGFIKVVLFDSRQDSPTYKVINEFKAGIERPMILTIPPKVFHAVQNIHFAESSLLNLVDIAYQYEDPDHWRVPLDHPDIPYKF
ncbi:MAG: dTDP-4-dehydrorhamnose 3,5-epimerase family protein [bacterium]|nr:dTDP-4-dehydrorhamnose 3,5-epimerase family protein [bacterium]